MTKRATPKFRRKMLMILQQNGYNISRTAREQKIQYQTLRDWKDKYGAEVWANPEPEKMEIIKEEQLARDKISLTATQIKGKSEDVVLKLLQLIDAKLEMDLTEKKISLRELTNTLDKTIPYILAKFESKMKDGGGIANMENNYTLFVQNMYNKLNDKSHAG